MKENYKYLEFVSLPERQWHLYTFFNRCDKVALQGPGSVGRGWGKTVDASISSKTVGPSEFNGLGIVKR